ncbi:LAFA_0G15698g1_1 [Lachancea sp. 'fantastica']|nr:LAFA_0G15698g1_1 [Lachancea sp. 'fantastica']
MSRHILATDFDETITNKDTISTLAELPYLYKSFSVPWTHFVDTYKQGCRNIEPASRMLPILEPWIHNPKQLITATNFDRLFQSEIEFQKSLRPIELNSIRELEKKEAFSGITVKNIQEFSRNRTFLLRDGFLEAWKAVTEVRVLSVNWSEIFIQSLLESAAEQSSLEGPMPPVQVACNNLIAEDGKLSGKFDKAVVTGVDKLENLKKLVLNSTQTATIWYVGDSETDILPILYPGVNGVVLLDPAENAKKLTKVTSCMGVPDEYLNKFAAQKLDIVEVPCKKTGALYLVKNWRAFARLLR